jgi:hypothetical protein
MAVLVVVVRILVLVELLGVLELQVKDLLEDQALIVVPIMAVAVAVALAQLELMVHPLQVVLVV